MTEREQRPRPPVPTVGPVRREPIVRKPVRGEWVRLVGLMALLIAFGALIVFLVGDNSGQPTQRSPMPPVSASPAD